jgi:hypothetical protein
MKSGFERRLLIVWLLLSAITLLSGWTGARDDQATAGPNAAITFGVMGLALVKVRIILREFMEVRHASVRLGRLTDGWLLLTAAILAGAYFAGMASPTPH